MLLLGIYFILAVNKPLYSVTVPYVYIAQNWLEWLIYMILLLVKAESIEVELRRF
jgi:hypothetical protein